MSILIKEIEAFFSTVTGYIVIGVFITVTGLFLWVFKDTSILDNAYATLDQLFFMTPYIFLFLIPALTMRSFADEFQKGTIELLYTKPITLWTIVWNKYIAHLILVLITILLSLIYYYSLNQLASPKGDIDHGAIIGSYLGMVLLGAAFTAIGIFASALSRNQITAFLTGVIINFSIYWGLYYLSRLPIFIGGLDIVIERVGMDFHYASISRGNIDTRDLTYFIFIVGLFISATYMVLKSRK
jgi:ABC-2 type transport system permease protein